MVLPDPPTETPEEPEITWLAQLLASQESLAREQRLTRTILDSLREAVVTVDAQGTILSANQSAETMFGYAWGTLEGRSADLLTPPAPVAEGKDREKEREEEGPTHLFRIAHRGGRRLSALHANGHTFPVEVRVARARLDDERLFVAMLTDVSREEDLEARLRYSEKMEAIGTLASGVAHDFNNILQGIMTAHELAATVPSADLRLQFHEEANAFVRRGSELIKQLMTFARREQSQATVFEVAPVLEDSIRRIARSVPDSTGLIGRFGSAPVYMEGSPLELIQIVENLAENASQARPRSRIEVSLDPARDQLVLQVVDDGHGMSEEVRARATEPFFSTGEPDQRRGLGLSVVHGIVRRHGGSLSIRSEPDGGTTVEVRIPHAPATNRPRGDGPASERKGRILLLDGGSIVSSLLRHGLMRIGYSIDLCPRPRDAESILLESSASYDAVFFDFEGDEPFPRALVSALRAAAPRSKIVLCSGARGFLPDSSALDGVVDRVLVKPFSLDHLNQFVSTELLGASTNSGQSED